MKFENIKEIYNEFIQAYDVEVKDSIWNAHSKKFKDFWNNKILSKSINEINDQESDEIIKILDRNGRGNRKDSEAIAKAMIPQGAWRRMFNELHSDKKLSSVITNIFNSESSEKRIKYINELYEVNAGRKNSLTGKSGNAINCFLAGYDPFTNLSIISLKDRKKFIEYFNFNDGFDFENSLIGEKIVHTNSLIINKFKSIGINDNARTITRFCYFPKMKEIWKNKKEIDAEEEISNKEENEKDFSQDDFLFMLESHLEDFIIENWDITELGKRYDLIYKDEELVSQQYPTGIGKIDILAIDKKTKRYVIIELKKNQTSDDTIGQLTRYMGWIEEHFSNSKPTIGIIIAGKFDERLKYAIKKVPDTEVYIYKVDFKLTKFEA